MIIYPRIIFIIMRLLVFLVLPATFVMACWYINVFWPGAGA